MTAEAVHEDEHGNGPTTLGKDERWVMTSGALAVLYVACLAGIVVSAALLGYSALFRSVMPVPHAAFLMTVIVLTGTSFVLFVRSLEAERRLSIESHWGGLGGGLGGWRVSRSVTYLFITAALAVLLWTAMPPYPGPPGIGYLGERYRGAIQEAQKQNIKQLAVSVSGGKLHLSGDAPSQAAVNEVWNVIKQENPAYDDVEVNFTIPKPNAAPGANSQPQK